MITDIGYIRSSSGEILLRMWETNLDCCHRPYTQHNHLNVEIAVVLTGKGIYEVNSNVHTMEPGDVFVFTSNEHHYVTEASQEGLKILNLHFAPRYLFGSSYDSLSDANIYLCFSHNPLFLNKISANDAGFLRTLLFHMRQELLDQQQETNLAVKSLLNLFLVSLIRDHNFAYSGFNLTSDRTYVIRRALEYIEKHLPRQLTLEEIAEAAGMSPNYFSTLFKEVLGVSLWSFLAAKRTELAARKLLNNKKGETILEIALQCGFNNTANFNKVFRKQMGTTPSEFRKHADEYPL